MALLTRLSRASPLSLSSEERCSGAFVLFLALCWTLSSMCLSLLYWGAKNQTKCLRGSITSAWERGRITFHALLPELLLMQPRTPPSVLLVARAHCWLTVDLVRTGTSQAFSANLLPSGAAGACAGAWGCPSKGAGLHASPC